MNFTTRVANLLIWFWTTYVLVALNAVKTAAIAASNTVQDNLDSAVNTIDNSISTVSTTLSTFQTSVNGSLTNINASITALQTYQQTGFVKDQEILSDWFSSPAYGHQLDPIFTSDSDYQWKAGRYNMYIADGGANLKNANGFYLVRAGGTSYEIDENDQLSIVFDGESIVSAKIDKRINVELSEADVKAAVTAYMTANPFTA